MRSVAGSIALAGALAVAMESPGPNETSRNKELVRRLFLECINPGRAELFAEIVAEDYQAQGGPRGPSGFAGIVAELRGGFPDLRYEIEDLIAEGDRVVVRWELTGTHEGPFRGLAPTGKRIRNSGIAIFQVRAGKVSHSWTQTDRLGFLQALGVVPEGVGVPPPPRR